MKIDQIPQAQRRNKILDKLYTDPTVRTFQRGWELEKIIEIFRVINPQKVLEVGTFFGGTLKQWIKNLEEPQECQIVSIDTYNAGVDNRYLFKKWAEDKGLDLVLIHGDSHAPGVAEKARLYAPYDFVFIDADHYYDSAKLDWVNYGSLCGSGGVVAFHDILDHPNHPEIEVQKLWREIQSQGYITQEIVENPDNDWGGIGVVYIQ